MSTAFRVVIPARFDSSRLPGKPLLDIHGKPMVQRVYERCLASRAAEVLVATDDERVAEAVRSFGGEACMTSREHSSGTDRVMEVAEQLGWSDETLVVNVQGDEPLLPASVINQVAASLDGQAGMATLCETVRSIRELRDTSAVKVLLDHQGRAIYFSRAPLPWCRDEFAEAASSLPDFVTFYRHLGIYAYRVRVLRAFVAADEAMLEKAEKLEQLRALYQGIPVRVSIAEETVPPGVDTPEDLQRVREALRQTD